MHYLFDGRACMTVGVVQDSETPISEEFPDNSVSTKYCYIPLLLLGFL